MDLRPDSRTETSPDPLHAPSGTRPVVASDVCPACRSAEVATLERLAGLARARIEGGRLVWLGETQIDWDGSETMLDFAGVVLVCPACGHEWLHPALELGP